MSLAILYGLVIGLRINLLYTTFLDTSFGIKENISKARYYFLRNIENPSQESITSALENLNRAELNADKILKDREHLQIFTIPLNDLQLQKEVQKLQVLLLDYRYSSSKLASTDPIKNLSVNKKELELDYLELDAQSAQVEKELRNILSSFIKIFRINQFALISISLFLSFFSVIVYYKYEKQRSGYLKKIEDASLMLEKGLRKSTKTEEELYESRRKLSTLLENLPGMVYQFKGDNMWSMDFVSANSIMITGYSPQELINDRAVSYYDLINIDDRKMIFDQVQKAVEEHKPYQLVYRIKTASGYEKWVWEQGSGIFSKEDLLIGLEGYITDITERKNVEDHLNLQSTALEAVANGIVITDKEGRVLWLNSAFTKLTGYSLKEILGENLRILKSGSHTRDFYEFIWKTILAGETWRGEIINKRKNGTLYTEELTITPVKSSEDEIKYFVAVKQDITERKKAEEALRESETRFRSLYENATIGIYRTTPDGKILMSNPTLVKIFGYNSLEELLQMNASEAYYDPSTREIFQRELLSKGKIFGFESIWKRKDGTMVYARESARVVKDENGNVLYYEGTVEDISEKKKIEEALIEAKERAEQSDRFKSEFLAQMSHEIRTPLNVILNFAAMLKEDLHDKVDDEMKDSFDVIDAEGKRIMRTVELILNMSELQTGSYNFISKRINLYEDVLKKIHRNLNILARQKKITFILSGEEFNAFIEADEYSLNQIFYHLIENAIKYTPEGKVEVIINRGLRNNVYVDVADTGIGIADEYMPLLFTPFSREEKGYTRNFEGNGLGLALVKKYCDLNGAEIKVTSVKGKGTTFRVSFPIVN